VSDLIFCYFTEWLIFCILRQGIAVWQLPLHDWQTRNGSPRAYMTWLQHTAITDVSCCAWDPTGQYPFKRSSLEKEEKRERERERAMGNNEFLNWYDKRF
jgi:hypothetical protein